MKKLTSRIASKVLLLAGLALAVSAQGATTNWSFSNAAGQADGGTAASSYAGGALQISGFAATNGNTALSGDNAAVLNSGFASNAKWGSQGVNYWSGGGLAMASDSPTNAPNHAIDNAGGKTESVLLSFSNSQVLTSIGIGYKSGDADISLWRFVGTASITTPAALTTVGADKASMIAAGWSLVNNYANLAQDTDSPYNLVNGAACTHTTAGVCDAAAATASSVGSSWWLITAFNSSYGSGTNLDQGNDFFKIAAVATNDCSGTTGTGGTCGPKRGTVPEPGSLTLAGLALGGLFFSRRRKTVTI